MTLSLSRTLFCALAGSAVLQVDLAAAQTPAPVSTPVESKTADALPAGTSPVAKVPNGDTSGPIVIFVNPTLPTVNVIGSAVSPETLKAAHDAGFKAKVADGKTHFCKTEAELGTRFVEEHCINEQQLEQWLIRAQQQRERLKAMKGAPEASH